MAHDETCEGWKRSLEEKTVAWVRKIGWVRVIVMQDLEIKEIDRSRYVPITRCPFCNCALRDPTKEETKKLNRPEPDS